MTEAVSVYVTAPSLAEARTIAKALVEDRLAACVNVLGEVQSLFHWQGAVEEETEVALIAKALARDMPRIEALIREVHSYDVPCIVAWPIVAGHAPYLDWIEAETAGKRAAS